MNWKFWQKKSSSATPSDSGKKPAKLPSPKELPQSVGRELIVVLKQDPDWVWKLKGVSRPQEGKKGVYDIRVFNPARIRESGIEVRNYHSLDEHPELVIYSGWYDKTSHAVRLEKIEVASAA